MLYAANAISLAGNNLTTIAIPWFVLATTGSASKTGITGFFAILPIIIASVLGGVVVDRLGYRKSSIISDLASGSTVAAIAILHSLDLLAFPALLVLVFLGAFLDAPGSTARAALIPDLAKEAVVSIESVSATTQIIERGSRLVSAPLAGILIAASGGGAVVGALLYARYGPRYPRRPVFIASFVLVGIPTLAYALIPPLWMVIVLQFLMGLAAGPLNPILMTVQFGRIPADMRARVFGAVTAGAFLAMPAGVLIGGFMIDAIGLAGSFLIFGLIYFAATA